VAEQATKRLRESRKLSLVLDLDHTLLHATGDVRHAAVLTDPSTAADDIQLVRLNGGASLHWIKLRPGTHCPVLRTVQIAVGEGCVSTAMLECSIVCYRAL
jgi:hypothetical protein